MKFYKFIVTGLLSLIFLMTALVHSQEKKEHPKSRDKTEKHKHRLHTDEGDSHKHGQDTHVHDDGLEHSHHDEDVISEHDHDANGNGHSHGNNKNGLVGREFGQYRAQEAREKIKHLEKTYQDKKGLIERAEEKIAAAKVKLSSLEADEKTKPETIAISKFKITRAEKHLNDLKFLMVRHQEFIQKQQALLDQVYED